MAEINKVVYNSQVLLDLTSDTVDASHLVSGYTAHSCDGSSITGTYVVPEVYDGSIS